MRSLIIEAGIIVLATLTAACADPVAPVLPGVEARGLVARRGPTAPVPVPDSVGIPPSIPPIFEEAPPGFDTAQ